MLTALFAQLSALDQRCSCSSFSTLISETMQGFYKYRNINSYIMWSGYNLKFEFVSFACIIIMIIMNFQFSKITADIVKYN